MATHVDPGILVPTRRKKVAAPAPPQQPQPQRAPTPPGADELVRLTNRTAVLTFVAAAAIIAALTSLPALLSSTTQPAWRVAAGVVVLGAVAAVLAVRRARALLAAAEAGATDGAGLAARRRP